MKIGILTLQGLNFGNRLQNYAMQETLARMGHAVRTFRRDNVRMRSARRLARFALKDDYVSSFHRFDRRISFSRDVVSTSHVSRSLSRHFDCFVIGSDQVWNPTFRINSDLEYLPMIPSERKIAYAASFGVSEIDTGRSRTAALLSEVGSISMRERAGADIVNGLVGRQVPVVLDPTMLLSSDDWRAVSRQPRGFDVGRPFLFKYFLGNDVDATTIDAIASHAGLDIVDVTRKDLKFGPAEFVWLASRASIVCTDSFHASVFALLHHRPLGVFERRDSEADMSSRFDTLCSDFKLEGHRSSDSEFGVDSIMKNDWESFEMRLAARREMSIGWLSCALGLIEADQVK